MEGNGDSTLSGGELVPNNGEEIVEPKVVDSIQEIKFNEQCFLISNIGMFLGISQLKKKRYDRIYRIDGNNPDEIMHKLAGWDIESLTHIPTDEISKYAPYIKIEKLYFIEGDFKNPIYITMPFSNYRDISDKSLFETQKTRGDAVGIKSFDFEFNGTNAAESERYVTAKLVLVFQSLEVLTDSLGTIPTGTERPLEYFYLDLIQQQKRHQGVNNEELNPRYFEVKITVGWNATTSDVDQKYESIGKKISFYLSTVTHEIDIDDYGKVTMTINYMGRREAILSNTENANILALPNELASNSKWLSKDDRIKELERIEKGFQENKILASDSEEQREQKRTINSKLLEEKKSLDMQEKQKLDVVHKQFLEYFFYNRLINYIDIPIREVHGFEDTADLGWNSDKYERFQRYEINTQKPEFSEPDAEGNITVTFGDMKVRIPTGKPSDSTTRFSQAERNSWYNRILMNKEILDKLRAAEDDDERQKILEAEVRLNSSGGVLREAEKENAAGIVEEEGLSDVTRNVRIEYIFLGDVIEYVLKKVDQNHDLVKFFLGPMLIDQDTEVVNFCLADMPISLNLFNQWYFEYIVIQQKSTMTALHFLQLFFRHYVENIFKLPCFYCLNDSKFNTKMISFSSNLRDDNTCRITNQKISLDSESGVKWGNDYPINIDQMDIESTRTQNKSNKLIDYYIIYSSSFSLSRVGVGKDDFDRQQKDFRKGIYHYYLGRDRGLVKRAKFSREDNPQLEAAQIEKNMEKTSDGQNGHLIYNKGVYNVNLEMVGNSMYTPGQFIYVNSRALRTHPDFQIGGYYSIIKVSNIIEAGKFDTNLECKWETLGISDEEQRRINAGESRSKRCRDALMEKNKKQKIESDAAKRTFSKVDVGPDQIL